MATKSTPESAALSDLIHTFIHTRLQAKLDKLADDDPSASNCSTTTGPRSGWLMQRVA